MYSITLFTWHTGCLPLLSCSRSSAVLLLLSSYTALVVTVVNLLFSEGRISDQYGLSGHIGEGNVLMHDRLESSMVRNSTELFSPSWNLKRCLPMPSHGMPKRLHREHGLFSMSHCTLPHQYGVSGC